MTQDLQPDSTRQRVLHAAERLRNWPIIKPFAFSDQTQEQADVQRKQPNG
jgi:hypothetical protein